MRRSLFFQYYRENANYLERTYGFVERLGIEKVRRRPCTLPNSVRQGLLGGCANRRRSLQTHGWNVTRHGIPPNSYKSNRSRAYPYERHAPMDSNGAMGGHSPARGTLRPSGRARHRDLQPRDRFLAVDNRCPHKGGPLSEGIVSGATVVCPLHAGR